MQKLIVSARDRDELEEENEALKEDLQRVGEDFADERDRLEKLAASLKQVKTSSICLYRLLKGASETSNSQG